MKKRREKGHPFFLLLFNVKNVNNLILIDMKKIKSIYKIILILLLSGSLNACGWLFTSKPTYEYVDQETKDYCLFEQGSYWIYQNSAILTIDSVVIDEPISYRITYASNHSESDSYSTGISLYSQKGTFKYRAGLSPYNRDISTLSINHSMMYHSGKILVSYRYLKDYVLLLEKKDNYLINGVSYSDVKIFKNYEDNKVCYWAKHVGLICLEVYKNDSVVYARNLIRYNVKPYKQ